MGKIKDCIFLRAYAKTETEYTEKYIKPTAENIANFIMQNRNASIIITDELDRALIAGFGGFIHTCEDKEFLLNELQPAIIPIQKGEKEPGEIEEYMLEETDKDNECDENMSINHISADELLRMKCKEGLVLQGCGGSIDEWVNGINDLLTETGILLNKTKFDIKDCYLFKHDGLNNLLFPFTDRVNLDVGKLAVWRIKTHEQFGGTWLSDYTVNAFSEACDDAKDADDEEM